MGTGVHTGERGVDIHTGEREGIYNNYFTLVRGRVVRYYFTQVRVGIGVHTGEREDRHAHRSEGVTVDIHTGEREDRCRGGFSRYSGFLPLPQVYLQIKMLIPNFVTN